MCIGWYRSQWCTSQLHITPTHGFSLVLVQLSWVWVTKNPLFTGILPDDGRRSIGFLSIWARPGRGKLISKFKAVANFFCKSPNSCYSNSGMGAESDPFPDELRCKILFYYCVFYLVQEPVWSIESRAGAPPSLHSIQDWFRSCALHESDRGQAIDVLEPQDGDNATPLNRLDQLCRYAAHLLQVDLRKYHRRITTPRF